MAFKKLLFFLLAKRIHSLPVREKYLLCLRKGKKEPLTNDTGKKKKDIKFLKGQNDSSSLNIFQNNTLLPVYCSRG